ncbi:L-threonine ammonia-lyase [Marinomonas alcarazii]|uniref:L-threonine dehydratase n=1 Tax=Marinomonas alcarazii TaxID=491949 RepID=A0A318V2U9_9GAMM|nr:threonine ammonia-lyase, biosynthetic [Marinomonas alcarazii]PYF82303.1 L-threonine ammonia-lyase [Marinomonas alcarazii]
MITDVSTRILNKIVKSPVFDYLPPTPLDYMHKLSQSCSNDVYIKREDLQPINSFKIRGAYQKIMSLTLNQLNLGVVAASAGNHAQGVAKVCKELGANATIVMPEVTPKIKVDAVRAYGAHVVLTGVNYDDAYDYAIKLANTHNMTLVHPFDDIEVIYGQGTIGVELLNQIDELDYLFVQVGGGGLLSGLLLVMRALSPNTKVIAVEPEGAQTLGESLKKKQVTKLDAVCTFSDGVAVRQIGNLPYNICSGEIDGHVAVANDEVCSAIQQIHEDTRAMAECSGAVGLAGANKYLRENGLEGKNVAVILSGSNINFQKLEYVAQRYNLGQMREKLLHIVLPERKGELIKLLSHINDVNITEIKYRKSKYDIRANIILSFSSNDSELLESKVDILASAGYTITDLTKSDIGKSHLRFMIGDSKFGSTVETERFYRLEFPEKQGQLLSTLNRIYIDVEITALNYRQNGQHECSLLLGVDSSSEPDYSNFKDGESYKIQLIDFGL